MFSFKKLIPSFDKNLRVFFDDSCDDGQFMFLETSVDDQFYRRFQIEFRFVPVFCHMDMDRFMVV